MRTRYQSSSPLITYFQQLPSNAAAFGPFLEVVFWSATTDLIRNLLWGQFHGPFFETVFGSFFRPDLWALGTKKPCFGTQPPARKSGHQGGLDRSDPPSRRCCPEAVATWQWWNPHFGQETCGAARHAHQLKRDCRAPFRGRARSSLAAKHTNTKSSLLSWRDNAKPTGPDVGSCSEGNGN